MPVLCGNDTPGSSMHDTSSVEGFFGSMPPRSSTLSSGLVSAEDHIVRTLRITTWFESDTLSEKPGVSMTVRFSIVSPSMCENERPSGALLPRKSRIVLRGPWPRTVTPSLGRPVSPDASSVVLNSNEPVPNSIVSPDVAEKNAFSACACSFGPSSIFQTVPLPGTPQFVHVGAYGLAFWQCWPNSGCGWPSATTRTAFASWPLHEPFPVTSQSPGTL